MRITFEQIRRNGGCYETKKYRYIIDTTTWEIKRTLIANLGTTAMLDKDAWETVKMERLFWDDLNDDEKCAAAEQYVYIRECEEQRSRDETSDEYPYQIDPEGVKSCTFIRESFEDGTSTVQVII